MDKRIQPHHREFWKPFTSDHVLLHLTTSANLQSIKRHGLQPRDPAPRHWAGTRGIWMSYPPDPLHDYNMNDIRRHVAGKGAHLVLLHVNTDNKLFRSTDPERTNQVLSLDPIPPEEIIRIEYLPEKPLLLRPILSLPIWLSSRRSKSSTSR